QGQGRAGEELLGLAGVGRAGRLEVQGVELAVAPVAQVEGLLVLRREPRAVAEAHPRRRARADVHDGRQALGVVDRPDPRAGAPAELAAGGDVADAGGAIPGRVHVPLHVGVEGEQLAGAIERRVELVAVADRGQLPGLALRVGPAEVTARRVDAAG